MTTKPHSNKSDNGNGNGNVTLNEKLNSSASRRSLQLLAVRAFARPQEHNTQQRNNTTTNAFLPPFSCGPPRARSLVDDFDEVRQKKTVRWCPLRENEVSTSVSVPKIVQVGVEWSDSRTLSRCQMLRGSKCCRKCQAATACFDWKPGQGLRSWNYDGLCGIY